MARRVEQVEGQVAVFDPRIDDSPCYRCLYNEGNDEILNCAEFALHLHPVGMRPAALAASLHRTRHLNGAAEQQQLFG